MLPRVRALVALLALMATALVGFSASPGWAAGCGVRDQGPANVISPSQTSTTSQVNTTNTMTVTVVNVDEVPVSGYCVDFVQDTGPSSGWPRSAISGANGQAAVTWTSTTAPPGNAVDSITASVTGNNQTGKAATLRHTWTPAATPRPTASPTKSPTPKPVASSAPPVVLSPTPAPSRTRSPTASPRPSPTPSASASGSPVPVVTGGSIHLDSPSALPGGTAGLSGANCPAGSTVTYSVEGTPAGSGTAGADGTFASTVQLPDAPIGQHLIQVSCAGLSATVPIDLVVSSSTSDPALGATAAAVLLFFVLLGSLLLSRLGQAPPRPVMGDPDAL